jgi:AcrR family transcriptional regulator
MTRRKEAPARGRPRSGAAHAAILSAAIALTREVGYDALSIEGIAERAGVGKTTIYRHWPSKELVIAEAIGGIVRRIPQPELGGVRAEVRQLMRSVTAMYRDPATGALLSGLVAAMARSAIVADAVRAGFHGLMRDALRQVLRRGITRGELRRTTDVELALDMLAGPLFYRYLMLGLPVSDRYTNTVLDAVLRAFGPATTTHRAGAARRRVWA